MPQHESIEAVRRRRIVAASSGTAPRGENYSAAILLKKNVPPNNSQTWKKNLSLPGVLPSREKSIL